MGRARNIKPGFFTNEELAKLPPLTRLLFIGLWTEADREGRLEDRPHRLRLRLFPEEAIDMNEAIQQLADAKFIERYHASGANYIQIINWHKHQRPHHKEAPSEIPKSLIGNSLLANGLLGKSPGKVGAQSYPSTYLGKNEPNPSTNLGKNLPEKGKNEHALIPDTGYRIPDCGREDSAALPAPPPASAAEDPQQTLRTLAQELCESLPAGGDLHLTAKQLETELAQSANHDLVTFCASVRVKLDLWAHAYRENRHLRPKQAQWWLRDGEYARKPPPTTATEAKGGTTERERLLSLFDEVRNAS